MNLDPIMLHNVTADGLWYYAWCLTSGDGWRREGALTGEALPNLEEDAEASACEEREAIFSRCTGV